METKLQMAKNYNFLTDLKLNDYIDAKDTVNHWCVGEVCDTDPDKNMIKIHFEGWTSRYDEWIKKNSQRIAPFRRHTEGYTGQKKTAYRDFKINYTQHIVMVKQIQTLTNQEFKGIHETGYALTQFIRGELYFQVDSLISLFGQTTSEDLPAIFEFIQEVFKMIIKWMEVFPKYLASFNETQQYPSLFLVDLDAAISACGGELFNIFEKCFGQCPRCAKFFQQKFGNDYIYDGIYANKDKVRGNGLMLSFLNYFGEINGFEAVLNFIRFELKDSKGKPYKACPLILTMKVLKPFVDILQQGEKQFVYKFTESVKQALMDRLENLTENEIKELDKEIIKDTIEVLRNYIFIIEPENAHQIAELKELKVAETYLRCPFFEKRVRGINDLKDIFYKVSNQSKTRAAIESQNLETMKWLTFDKYAKWLIERKIVEYIFQENPHVELIKRSVEILKLLANNEATFPPSIIEMMWVCCREKHEDIVRATFDVIQEIAYFLPLERLAQLYSKISTIKDIEYDEKTIIFLKNYTLSAMKNIRSNKKMEQKQSTSMTSFLRGGKKEVKIDEMKFYDPIKFWIIFQDSNKVSAKVKDLALNSLIEIIQEINEKEIKEQYYIAALDNIKRGDTFLSSIIFLRKILNTYPLDSQIKFRPGQTIVSVSQILQDISKKFDIFDMIFKNTQAYMITANISKVNKQGSLQSGDKLQSQQLVGSIVHEDFIKVIFNLIEFILINSKVTLSFDNVERMFHMFVKERVTEFETNSFFILLTKENEQAKSNNRRFLLDDKIRNEVFQKIFCNDQLFNCERINHYGFQCFKKLFIIVNEEEKALEIQREEKVTVFNLNMLQGIESFWQISIKCQNQQVKDACKDFLVDLYLRAKTKSNAQKKQITEIFTEKCFQYFKNFQNKSDYQLNCLRLIKTFISRFDGDHIVEEDITQYDQKECKTIQVTLAPDKIQTQVKVHPNQKLWQLKRKMANALRLKLSEFYIKTKNGPLEEHIYNEPIKDYSIAQIHIQRVSQDDMEREFPRYLIGYNMDYISLFIDLLSKSNEVCSREVLNLLESLPFNKDTKEYLQSSVYKFNQDTPLEDWGTTISWEGGKNLSYPVYYLMTLEEMIVIKRDIAITNQEITEKENMNKNDFFSKFLTRNGFSIIETMFFSIEKSNLENQVLKTKALTLLLRLISYIFQAKQFSLIKNQLKPQVIEKLIHETLNIINSFIRTCYSQQSQTIIQNSDTRQLKNEDIILQHAFIFLYRALSMYPQSINTVFEYKNVSEMMRIALIDIESNEIKIIVQKYINEICQKLEVSQSVVNKPSYFFMKVYLNDCLEYALKLGSNKTRIFFDSIIFIQSSTEIHKRLNDICQVDKLVQMLCTMIFQRDIIEMSARDEDVSLSGLFMILRNLLDKFPLLRQDFNDKNKLLMYLIHDGLFHQETKGQLISKFKAMPPKCKHAFTREQCLKLLNMLCLENPEGVQVLIKYFKSYISETFWRTQRKVDWAITVHQQERSTTGFVGLKNIGCICYMNSILQQLFMIPTFRKAILEVEDSRMGIEQTEENSLYQLKMIFGGLMEVEKQYYNPKKFCSAFKDIDGSPIDPTVQKDVDEFFNMLLDRIENLILGKKEEKMIKNLFQGVYANEFICKECPHYSEREEMFQTINLQVKNKHSIKESLDAFVEGEMLEGDNAYYCEKCEKKVNTLKRCCIKRMPNVLFLVLKRFEFNFDTMTKFKINDYCEFPMAINMRPYSQEGLSKQDLLKEMESKNLTYQDLNEEQKEILDKQIPDKYYDYKLKGTVIHLGTADQGHYYSFIQDRENSNQKWYEFNDKDVKDFDQNDIPYEAFGGDDEGLINDIQNMKTNGDNAMLQVMKQYKTKIKNAYILIYERDDILDMERFNECMDDPNISTSKEQIEMKFEQCKLPKTSSTQIQIPPVIHDEVLEKNKKFWLSKFIFNKQYIDNILHIFKDIKIEEDSDYRRARERDLQNEEGGQFEMFKFLTTFFLTTVIRAKERKSIPQFMKIIREALEKNILLCVWLLETFTNQDIIKELVIDSPIPDMKRFVAGLLKTALIKVYPFEEKQILEYCNSIDSDPLEYIKSTQSACIKGIKVIDGRANNVKGETFNTFCSEATVIALKHHNEALPISIIMMNSFIHQATSIHNIKSAQICGQFYMVFAHFAELGQNARLYLFKTKCLGRLLDLFLNGDPIKLQALLTSPQYQAQQESIQQTLAKVNKFRNETMKRIPLFSIEKKLYLETNIKKSNVLMSEPERKAAYNQIQNPYQFLIYTISVLARSCVFVKGVSNSPFSNDDLNYIPDQDEFNMLINHQNDQWWSNCYQKVPRNYVALLFAHISYENKEFSMQYMSTLLQCYNRSTFDQMKIYERPLMKLFQIQDSYQADRIKKGLASLHDIMKNSLQYYKYTDSLTEFIFKCASRIPMVVEIMNKNSNYYRQIEQWTKEYPHFPLNQSKVKIFKQGIVNWNNKQSIVNQQTLDRVSAYSKERLQKLWKVLQKENQTIDSYDSDDDMYQHKFQQGEKLDFCDNNDSWHTGFVEIQLDEMVKCISETVVQQSNNQPVTYWIETESDKLAPPQTHTTSDKKKIFQFYQNLLKNVQN